MDGQTLFENALALLCAAPDQVPEYGPFALPLVNLLLAETAGVNNGLRIAAGKVPLQQLPALEALSDTLPCEQELAARALPYGLCALLLPEEGDLQKAVYFQNLYAMALEDLKRCEPGAVLDCYGGPAV